MNQAFALAPVHELDSGWLRMNIRRPGNVPLWLLTDYMYGIGAQQDKVNFIVKGGGIKPEQHASA